MGIVAATGCNTVFGSTYPYNPYLVPWTNSLFENAPADAARRPRALGPDGPRGSPLWVIGGDGAMYDIGFQALSRMVASGADIKVFVLDTQVYSNTGGQASTASFAGQDTKMSAFGAAQHGRAGAAQGARPDPDGPRRRLRGPDDAAHINHFYRAILEANEFPGPAVVIGYTTCLPEHGIADNAAGRQARLAVDSRAFPLFTYDPRRGDADQRAAVAAGQPGDARGLVDHAGRRGGGLPRPSPAARDGSRRTSARTASRRRRSRRRTGDRLANWRTLQELGGLHDVRAESCTCQDA